jgi:hypothetical protein
LPLVKVSLNPPVQSEFNNLLRSSVTDTCFRGFGGDGFLGFAATQFNPGDMKPRLIAGATRTGQPEGLSL